MRARLVAFPIKGRTWCFSRRVDSNSTNTTTTTPLPTIVELWRVISAGGRTYSDNIETIVDFTADKMNRAWVNLGKAPAGSFKSRLHSLGVRLLSHVQPSEEFLKSVDKDVSELEITYPANINPRMVRRRLRHIAVNGASKHKSRFYGSVCLVPATGIFMVLPFPNVPFFWVLFRTYSHWRALQGSERLLLLVSDSSKSWKLLCGNNEEDGGSMEESGTDTGNDIKPPWFHFDVFPYMMKPANVLTPVFLTCFTLLAKRYSSHPLILGTYFQTKTSTKVWIARPF